MGKQDGGREEENDELFPDFYVKFEEEFPFSPFLGSSYSQPPTSQSSAVALNKLPLCTKPLRASGTLLLRAAIKYTKREQLKSKSAGNAEIQNREI